MLKFSDKLAFAVFAVFALCMYVQAADQYKFNPFTGKLDNVGDAAIQSGYSAAVASIPTVCTGANPIYDGAETIGPAGPGSTIAVGTVTTGAAGSSAAVTNIGSPSAAIFDFAIPKGDQGATGAGVATGGTAGQYLKKNSATDYDTTWGTLTTDLAANTLPFSNLSSQYVSVTPITVTQTSSTRYTKTNITKDSTGAISNFMLGSGALVLGTPYTDAFVVSGWVVESSDGGATWSGSTTSITIAKSTHSADPITLIKGSNILFRNFTSFTIQPSVNTSVYSGVIYFSPRRSPSQHTRVRVVLTTAVKDIEGNALFTTYSSPFLLYSTAGI